VNKSQHSYKAVVPSDTFAVGCIVYPQNAPQKNELKKLVCIGLY